MPANDSRGRTVIGATPNDCIVRPTDYEVSIMKHVFCPAIGNEKVRATRSSCVIRGGQVEGGFEGGTHCAANDSSLVAILQSKSPQRLRRRAITNYDVQTRAYAHYTSVAPVATHTALRGPIGCHLRLCPLEAVVCSAGPQVRKHAVLDSYEWRTPGVNSVSPVAYGHVSDFYR